MTRAVQNDELKRTMDITSIFPILLNGPSKGSQKGLGVEHQADDMLPGTLQ